MSSALVTPSSGQSTLFRLDSSSFRLPTVTLWAVRAIGFRKSPKALRTPQLEYMYAPARNPDGFAEVSCRAFLPPNPTYIVGIILGPSLPVSYTHLRAHETGRNL